MASFNLSVEPKDAELTSEHSTMSALLWDKARKYLEDKKKTEGSGQAGPNELQIYVSWWLRRTPVVYLGIGAPAGSGKTLSFLFPILADVRSLASRAKTSVESSVVIVANSEPLALQLSEVARAICPPELGIDVNVKGGKWPIDPSQQHRKTVMIGTLGRIQEDFRRYPKLSRKLRWLVLDEAKKYLSDYREDTILVGQLGPECRTVLVDSMWVEPDDDFYDWIRRYTMRPTPRSKLIVIGNRAYEDCVVEHHTIVTANDWADRISQLVDDIERPEKYFDADDRFPGLIFCNTKQTTNTVFQELQQRGFEHVHCYHSGLAKNERLAVLSAVADGEADLIVATDVLSHGIDWHNFARVYNFDAPYNTTQYIARSCRVGRDFIMQENNRPFAACFTYFQLDANNSVESINAYLQYSQVLMEKYQDHPQEACRFTRKPKHITKQAHEIWRTSQMAERQHAG